MSTPANSNNLKDSNRKQSIVFYADWFEIIEQLPLEKRYDAFRAIGEYAMDSVETTDPQLVVFMAFVKRQIDRDNDRYSEVREHNHANGKKGGRPRRNSEDEAAVEKALGAAVEKAPGGAVEKSAKEDDCRRIVDLFNDTIEAGGVRIPRVSLLTSRRCKAINHDKTENYDNIRLKCRAAPRGSRYTADSIRSGCGRSLGAAPTI